MTASQLEKTRIENRWPIAREGLPFILTSGIVTILLFYGGLPLFAILTGIICLFIIYFFRDPARVNDNQANTVLSPADGKILSIQSLKDANNPLGAPAVKVSIFMSVFNVHVNRIPVDGRVLKINYSPGKFFSANLDKASDQNENNRITLETDVGKKIVFVQIAGLIARRIVCWVNEQDFVRAGQRFGLIRFGSRVDVYIPAGCRITVQPRDKVSAGKTAIGYLP